MSGDLENAVQTLAADNAKLCTIAIAADKLAEATKAFMGNRWNSAKGKAVLVALDAYNIARQGN